ncbi:MAG TPA: hypothetical protein VFG28_08925 [Syntrophales bacterium]|nr:hypothetical protein [Syntrophales bacterium]
MDERAYLIIILVLCIGFIVFFMSRSGENYGTLKPSEGATASLQSYREDADLDYYYSGPESHPLAIIGVEKKFRFDSAKHWMKIGPGQEALKRLMEAMQSRARERNQNLRGFEMVDQKGERIGEWYSVVGIQPAIKRTGIDSVEVWPPPPAKVEP